MKITSGIYDLDKVAGKAVEQLQFRIEHPDSIPVKILCNCDIVEGETD